VNPLELAEAALAHAGAEAQVTVVRERSLTSRFARSAPTQATSVDDVTIEILCLADGHTAAATTNLLDDESIRRCAARARAAAQAAARLSNQPGDYPGLPAPQDARVHNGFDAGTAELDPAAAGTALSAAFAYAAQHGAEAFGIWTAGEVGTAIASGNGIQLVDTVTDAHMRVMCLAPNGRSGFASHTSVTSADLDGLALARRASHRLDTREAQTLEPGEYPVVLEAEAVATLLGFLGGLAFNGLAHEEGRGALSGRLGTRVAAPCVSLADSPRASATLPRSFDSEGIPKSPMPLLEQGIARAVTYDVRSAARAGAGARSTGHALAPGGDPEGPQPTNLVLDGGGAANENDLATPIERGLYVTRLWYVNTVHERDTLLTGMTRDGTFLIEGGRISAPLRDVRFTDSVLRLLSATEALSREQRLISEADLYGRRFAHGSICPALRAQGFRITGSTVA
jgi:PmbA protein